jgi:hypothetical protein
MIIPITACASLNLLPLKLLETGPVSSGGFRAAQSPILQLHQYVNSCNSDQNRFEGTELNGNRVA